MKIVKMVDDKEEKMDEIVSFFSFRLCQNILCQHITGLQHEHTTQ